MALDFMRQGNDLVVLASEEGIRPDSLFQHLPRLGEGVTAARGAFCNCGRPLASQCDETPALFIHVAMTPPKDE